MPVDSWGANIFQQDGLWHMFASEFANHCDISKWSPNSRIIRATSTTGPEGPYTYSDTVVTPFAHNPKVVRAPDGTWLMYTIGTPVAPEHLKNCSSLNEEGPHKPGRVPGNLESNVTLFTAESLTGRWTRFGIVLGSNYEGTWDEDTSNPSPFVLPNGTVLLMYRGCIVSGKAICRNDENL